MPRITPTDWQTQVRVFEAYGCAFVRQKGDHLIYRHPDARRPVVIPRYKEVTVTVIKANMRTVGMTREEYFDLLERAK
jgi:predicted RNA binding protein YcfA (HicA-like mRNA interferase family)